MADQRTRTTAVCTLMPRRRARGGDAALGPCGILALAILLALGIVGPRGLLAQTPSGFDDVRVHSSLRIVDDANPLLSHNIPRLEADVGGQTLTADFAAFYESTGGLTRWGLPISEVFVERPGALTQYFQRGVVDFHPRPDLGGAYRLERRLTWDHFGGGLGGSQDMGVEPGTTNENPGELHGPWGHKVSNFSVAGVRTGFLDFFQTYGGVDSFGFPKTEARIDTTKTGMLHIATATPGFIRQYFQAAVFEYHPGRGVRLRLLGDDLRNRRYPDDAWRDFAAFNAASPLTDGQEYRPEVVEYTRPAPITPTPSPTPTPVPTPTPIPTPTPVPTPTPDPFRAWTPAPSVVWVSSFPPTYPFRDIPREFTIIGDSACVSQTKEALNLLKRKIPNHYNIANQYVGIIRCVERGSAMFTHLDPPEYRVGRRTREAGAIWYSSTIVHDACHSKQYHDYLAIHSVTYVPDDVYIGREPELQCLAAQYNALKGVDAPDHMLEYVRESIESEYWEIPYEERDWSAELGGLSRPDIDARPGTMPLPKVNGELPT